jgi:hypothetical protein
MVSGLPPIASEPPSGPPNPSDGPPDPSELIAGWGRRKVAGVGIATAARVDDLLAGGARTKVGGEPSATTHHHTGLIWPSSA